MSTAEIAVIAFGLFLGYWVVSRLLGGNAPPESPHQEASGTSEKDGLEGKSSAPLDWYEVLNVSPSATTEEIRAAYKSLIRQYHPDKVASLGVELRDLAEQKSKAITVAYRHAMRLRGANE